MKDALHSDMLPQCLKTIDKKIVILRYWPIQKNTTDSVFVCLLVCLLLSLSTEKMCMCVPGSEAT